MSRPRTTLAAVFAIWAGAAQAQYYYGPYYYGAPYPTYPSARQRAYADPYYADPRYADPDAGDGYNPRQRPRNRRILPSQRDSDDDYAGERAPQRRRGRAVPLPFDADPSYSTAVDYDEEVDLNETTREIVSDPTGRAPGTITIDTQARKLYLSLPGGQAIEYGVGVGREGFAWKGQAQVGRKAFWPGWTPPKEMLLRRPDLPMHMEGGLENPLGARAIYLFRGDKDTMFRIHGTNEPDTIGQAVSSGCIRMMNADVIDLYKRVSKGARVVVL